MLASSEYVVHACHKVQDEISERPAESEEGC